MIRFLVDVSLLLAYNWLGYAFVSPEYSGLAWIMTIVT